MCKPLVRCSQVVSVMIALVVAVVGGSAQEQDSGIRYTAGPDDLATPRVLGPPGQQIRVTQLVKGLDAAWGMAMLPNGDILIAERPGKLRLVRDLKLDPQPISGLPEIAEDGVRKGLWDVILHPKYAENGFVYFAYARADPKDAKSIPESERKDRYRGPVTTVVVGRGVYRGGHALTDVRDIFVADAWTTAATLTRMVFGPDGKLYVAMGEASFNETEGGNARIGTATNGQDPMLHNAKTLRLNDDGTVPPDNPFVGKAGYRPEIFTLGHRNMSAVIVYPPTGEIWEAEHGPFGGDEVNILRPGKNYGWPVISLGKQYAGSTVRWGPEMESPAAPGVEQPFIAFIPSIAPGGMMFYTGDKFPYWKGNLFVTGLAGTQMHRVVLNRQNLVTGRSALLTDMHRRLRTIAQGPDGLIYLLTDDSGGRGASALLRIEPVSPEPRAPEKADTKR